MIQEHLRGIQLTQKPLQAAETQGAAKHNQIQEFVLKVPMLTLTLSSDPKIQTVIFVSRVSLLLCAPTALYSQRY